MSNEQDRLILQRLATDLVARCPDMRQLARELGASILDRRANSRAEPDTVYWHRFDSAQSSPHTFNGWAHYGAPLAHVYAIDGGLYLAIGDVTCQTRYVAELKTWIIVDPQNPYAFYRNLPVTLGADGQWLPLPTRRLQGGMKSLVQHLPGRRAGTLSPALERYLRVLDEGHDFAAHEPYTFTQVMKAAQRNGCVRTSSRKAGISSSSSRAGCRCMSGVSARSPS